MVLDRVRQGLHRLRTSRRVSIDVDAHPGEVPPESDLHLPPHVAWERQPRGTKDIVDDGRRGEGAPLPTRGDGAGEILGSSDPC